MQEKNKEATSALGGATAGILGVSTFVHGSSAATLTSKLALIGGGSMTMGITVIAMLPVVGAGAFWLIYRKYQNKKGDKN